MRSLIHIHDSTKRESPDFFCKAPANKYIRLYGPNVLVTYPLLVHLNLFKHVETILRFLAIQNRPYVSGLSFAHSWYRVSNLSFSWFLLDDFMQTLSFLSPLLPLEIIFFCQFFLSYSKEKIRTGCIHL